MESSYEIRAQRFVRDIFPFINGCVRAHDYCDRVKWFNACRHRNVKVEYGQTRVVLITSDYVVKIDYGTRARYYGGCADELIMYNRAVEAGFEYLFAKISLYTYCGHDFYIMPKVDGIGDAEDEAYDLVTPEESDWLYDNVNDLHYKNFGFKDDRVVLVDYACREDRERPSSFPSWWSSTNA